MGKPRKKEREVLRTRLGPARNRVVSNSAGDSTEDQPSFGVENCLKAALRLCLENGSEWVSNQQLAVAVGLSPGSISQMLKVLAEGGFAVYKPYVGIKLTDSGREVAARMLRRHRLIETFLARVLNLSWDQVHVEAVKMEHSMSDLVIDRIDDLLECPSSDPHGDPIPASNGTMRWGTLDARPLGECASGTPFRLVRVINQEREFLRYLASCGVGIGVEAVVASRHPEVGTITIRLKGKTLVLSQVAAASLLVETS